MITEDSPGVVVVGAASVDVKGKACAALLDATSNPGEILTSVGESLAMSLRTWADWGWRRPSSRRWETMIELPLSWSEPHGEA